MQRFFLRRGVLVALVALLAIGLFTACGDDDDNTKNPPVADVDNAALITAINSLDNAGFHATDESINTDGKVPATARTTALHMQAIVKLTKWPADSQKTADDLAKNLGDFANAINTDKPDMKAAGTLAHNIHEGEHDLSHGVWNYLQGKAGVAVDKSTATD
jgi:hypothetical protein